jgi:CheY-like chemotaxis protein/tetratricopeptide (TPR) repeat protein
MNLESQLATLKTEGRSLSVDERASLACELARQLERAGEYERARQALSEFWSIQNEIDSVDAFEGRTKGELLLRIGVVSGWLGSANQAAGLQESAKDLITRSIELFEELSEEAKVAEARADLALCYWREGSYDEARINLVSALNSLKGESTDLKATILQRAGLVEVDSGRLHEALRLYYEAAPLIEKSKDHSIRGTFHNEFGLVFRRLSAPENREDYVDRALIEYSAASFHFNEAGNSRYLARVENNLGFLFFTIGRYKDAHKHLDRARQLFLELKDVGTVAQVDDTRARTLLAEGRLQEAERFARSAVRTLEKGDEQALLAEALTTHGIALARLGNHPSAKALLQRAIDTAETAGDLEGAGRAKLSIIEELAGQTSAVELASVYESAADLLDRSQDPSTSKRLIACARMVIGALGAEDNKPLDLGEPSWENFSFRQEIKKLEKAVIERALRDAGGSVTKASKLLGFRHHQSLISLINGRHNELLRIRSAVQKRRHHLFSEPKRSKRESGKAKRTIAILHAEDDPKVAGMLGDLCRDEDWQIELCEDGNVALDRLNGNQRFDLLLLDSDLPGLSGLELILRARSMSSRRRTPIIMLSSDECETEAWRAGVDAFLRKPRDLVQVPSTIARLLHVQLKSR